MISQLFDYKSWNDIDLQHFTYHDCTLKMDMGSLQKDDVIDVIAVDYETGIMECCVGNGVVVSFELIVRAKPI